MNPSAPEDAECSVPEDALVPEDVNAITLGIYKGENNGKSTKSKEKLVSDKMIRLIEWNTDVLRKLLQQLVANRLNHINASTTNYQLDEYDDFEIEGSVPYNANHSMK